MVITCLNVHHSCATCFFNFLNVLFWAWVWTKHNACITYFLKSEWSHEISISFVAESIYYEDFVSIMPVIILAWTMISLIKRCILNIELPLWILFPLNLSISTLSSIIVNKSTRWGISRPNSVNTTFDIWHLYGVFPWNLIVSIFDVHPV